MSGSIGKHLLNNLRCHLLQFVKELTRFIFMRFNISQLLFPLSSKFGALKQFFMYNIDKSNTNGSWLKAFTHLTDVLSLV